MVYDLWLKHAWLEVFITSYSQVLVACYTNWDLVLIVT